MAGYIQDVVDAAHDPEVAVGITLGAVACQVDTAEFGREVAFLEAFRIAPDITDHGRPGPLDHEEAAFAGLDLLARFVDDPCLDARQRQRAGARLERRGPRQRRDHVHTGFGLPPSVHHRAALTTHVSEVPHPRLRIDGFADGTDNA